MNLNPQQQKVVAHSGGPILVLAGPGSGKTRVLVHRIARLVNDRIAHPSEILAVTFTNKAAGEMRRRIGDLIGTSAREMTVGTFHSVCLRILRKHAEKFGYADNFIVFDDSDQTALVKECMNVLNLDQARLQPNAIVDRISRAKDACLAPDEFKKASAGNFMLEKVAKVYELYQRRLAELQAVDFGDLIRLAVKLFDEEPSILQGYERRWRHIHVDEYQDTNRAQYRFVEHLGKAHRNLCVVGDDDQSIYSWRGADVSNILRFEKDFPGAVVVRLEQNYRSTKTILRVASAVVGHNAGRREKEIWTENSDGERVSVISCDSEKGEAESVAERIASQKAAGGRLGDVAVFYRTNAQSRPFEDVFRSRGISYRIYGGLKFYERAEVKDVLAYLRLIVDPKDDVGLRRIINMPTRGIGKTTVERLGLFARGHGMPMLDAIDGLVHSGQVNSGTSKRLSAFRQLVGDLRQGYEAKPLGEQVRQVLEKSGYIESLVAASSIEAEGRIENINELVTAMEEFIPQLEGPHLPQFLDQVALISDADAIDEEQGTVMMMTVHLAKGLEFPIVFIVGLEEGLFPHIRSLDDPDELEEERRLCYVGMTRAMKRLYLSHAFRRRHFGSERYNVASRFLDEIPDGCVEKLSMNVSYSCHREESREAGRRGDPAKWNRTGLPRRPAPRNDKDKHSFDPEFDQRPPEEISPYASGMRVRHPIFGTGVIGCSEPTSSGHRVTVRFQSGQTKRLIAECAGLVVI